MTDTFFLLFILFANVQFSNSQEDATISRVPGLRQRLQRIVPSKESVDFLLRSQFIDEDFAEDDLPEDDPVTIEEIELSKATESLLRARIIDSLKIAQEVQVLELERPVLILDIFLSGESILSQRNINEVSLQRELLALEGLQIRESLAIARNEEELRSTQYIEAINRVIAENELSDVFDSSDSSDSPESTKTDTQSAPTSGRKKPSIKSRKNG